MAVKEPVKFGTDGWRGIIAKDYTFHNVARVSQALADFLKDSRRKKINLYKDWNAPYRGSENGVVIGYDTRFLSEKFALAVAEVMEGNGIPVKVSNQYIATPCLSYAVEQYEAACGVMITSSHNPAPYNGYKIKAEFGGSAPPAFTHEVERRLPRGDKRIQRLDVPIERVDFTTPYIERLKELVDLDLIASLKAKVVIDSMHGSGTKCLATILKEIGIECVEVRAKPDPMFGGYSPEPTPQNLTPLKAVVRAQKQRLKRGYSLIGLVTDGDADRIGGMDDMGEVLTSHMCYSLILRHLIEKGMTGKIIKSFALTDMVDKIAAANGFEVEQVPIGFKYIAEKMLQADVMIGGEESGGIAVKGHVMERDGLYMALLLLEAVAKHKKPVSKIVTGLMKEFGQHHYTRKDIHFERRLEVVEILKSSPPAEVGGMSVQKVEDLDGVKLRFDNGWLMFRASGTEPLLRIYCEMDSADAVDHMIDAAKTFVHTL
jgi:phosphomannomutase